MKNLKLSFFILLTIFISSCNSEKEEECLSVSAGMGMKIPVSEICKKYEEKTGIKVKVNLASSGVISRQLVQGNKCDVILLANKKWANFLEEKDKLKANTKTPIVQNRLVAISPKKSNFPKNIFSEKSEFIKEYKGKLSIGNPKTVPAGKYAMEAITNLKWKSHFENKMLLAKDVRAAMRVVEMNEISLGIVYKTEALSSKKVEIIGEFPDKSHSPIIFMIAQTKEKNPKSEELYNFLINNKEIWKKYGYEPL